jgi:hypothetical protein
MSKKFSVFEYMILYHPPTKKDKDGNEISLKSEIVVDLKRILAKDEQQALLMIAREIPEEYVDKLSDIEIAVRPF